MSFIPILFSTPMVQAILNDRKTMTRRVVKPQPEFDELSLHKGKLLRKGGTLPSWYETGIKCPYGQVGDVLWVRERFSKNEDGTFDYKADYPITNPQGGWKPSIHMPMEACRIFLKITKIKVERLQNISGKDAVAEGVRSRLPDYGVAYYDFQALWIIINGADSWNANPWVWAIEFERVEKPVVFDWPLHSISHAISTVQDSYKVNVAGLNHGFKNKRTAFFKRLLESRFFYFNKTGECVYSIPSIERIDTNARMDLCPHDFYCWVTFIPHSKEVLMITRVTRTWSVVPKDRFYLGALTTLFRYYDARTNCIGPFQDLMFSGNPELLPFEKGMQLKQDALNCMNDGK